MLNETFVPTATNFRVAPVYADIEASILRTVAYADVFDYPLKATEITRYLIGMPATLPEVLIALESGLVISELLRFSQGYYTLAGRENLMDLRLRREQTGECRWKLARRYGKWIAALPFVRMVAVTGALAVDNEEGPDLDFLVVTSPGRVWLCRGMVMLLVHWARRYGDEICPNYFLSESALSLAEQTLYTAHEMAQMVPLSGMKIYQQMRELNPWVAAFLPNATDAPVRMGTAVTHESGFSVTRRAMEALLLTATGDWVENWEMRRKVRKFSTQESPASETDFCRDWCKGHFGGYGKKTRQAYHARLQRLGVAEEPWELG